MDSRSQRTSPQPTATDDVVAYEQLVDDYYDLVTDLAARRVGDAPLEEDSSEADRPAGTRGDGRPDDRPDDLDAAVSDAEADLDALLASFDADEYAAVFERLSE